MTIQDYLKDLKPHAILYGVNGIDLRNIYNKDAKTLDRLKWCPSYIEKCEQVILRLEQELKEA